MEMDRQDEIIIQQKMHMMNKKYQIELVDTSFQSSCDVAAELDTSQTESEMEQSNHYKMHSTHVPISKFQQTQLLPKTRSIIGGISCLAETPRYFHKPDRVVTPEISPEKSVKNTKNINCHNKFKTVADGIQNESFNTPQIIGNKIVIRK